MTAYVMRNGKLVEKHLAEPLHASDQATQVISDTMDQLRHMADGNYYDSKSKFRKATKANNCVEYGNEVSTLLKPRQPIKLDRRERREDIAKAIYQLKNR